jgi:hypothetical protein
MKGKVCIILDTWFLIGICKGESEADSLWEYLKRLIEKNRVFKIILLTPVICEFLKSENLNCIRLFKKFLEKYGNVIEIEDYCSEELSENLLGELLRWQLSYTDLMVAKFFVRKIEELHQIDLLLLTKDIRLRQFLGYILRNSQNTRLLSGIYNPLHLMEDYLAHD